MESRIKHILDRLSSHEIGKKEAEQLIMAVHADALNTGRGYGNAYTASVAALHHGGHDRWKWALYEVVRSLSGVSELSASVISKMYEEIHPQNLD